MRRRQMFQLTSKRVAFIECQINVCPYCGKEFKDARGRKTHLGTHK